MKLNEPWRHKKPFVSVSPTSPVSEGFEKNPVVFQGEDFAGG